MHTPVANAGLTYATVTYKGKLVLVHRLVWITFMGPIPEGMTIDHMISNHKFDNRLSALRLATRTDQNLNQDHKPISERENSKKNGVEGKMATSVAVQVDRLIEFRPSLPKQRCEHPVRSDETKVSTRRSRL